MHPLYPQVLARVKSGQQFLDLGCGFGQNLRKLNLDGAPAGNITGADVSRELIDCGYEYFRDRDRLDAKFIVGDILDSRSEGFVKARGSFDAVYAAMVYHLWDWENQLKASIETVKLLKPCKDSVLFGWQLGSTPASAVERRLEDSRGR